MCGFVAIINKHHQSINIGSLLDTIRHRGPDDQGWLDWQAGQIRRGQSSENLSGEVILGHVRLSIIDLSKAGWQPMSSADERYHLVFNGEIYNYLELRKELESIGHIFHTRTDTEVLLVALIEWKESAITKLRGMFSFCFFDSRTLSMIIARDFFGIKPLYFSKTNGLFAFASEQKALLMLPGVSNRINAQSLYEYLQFGTTDQGAESMFEIIHQIPAGHYVRLSIDDAIPPIPIRYWSVDLSQKIHPTFQEAVQRVRELFLQSVALHLRSDVPVGTALSGGIDSSAIVCAVRYLNPNQEIHTFSFIADDEKLSEEKWVDIVNRHIGAITHKIHATREEMLDDLDDLIRAQGEPFGSTSIYAQYRVFKEAAKQNIKVMLDGQGADEMLGGYVYYQGSRLASIIKRMNVVGAYTFWRKSSYSIGRSAAQLTLYTVDELLPDWVRWNVRKLLSKGIPFLWLNKNWLLREKINIYPNTIKGIKGKDVLRLRMLETLTSSSIPHLLRYEDRNSMRFSIESRVPFLYTELVEYLYSLPEEYLIAQNGTSKYVFREAMRGIVPDEILDRKDKVGFATPERAWLTKMDLWVEKCLSQGDSLGCFEMNELRADWKKVMEGEAPFNFRCWRWFNAIEWYAQNLKEQDK
jgi:asparagine synthase (glutamine-hydrolysing)